MTTLETVGVIVAVSLAMMFVWPMIVFQTLKMGTAGFYVGRWRARQRMKETPRGRTQDRRPEEAG